MKTTKSKLLSLLEKDVAPVEQIPNDTAWIVDAMALLQSIISAPATFSDLALKVFDIATISLLSGGIQGSILLWTTSRN